MKFNYGENPAVQLDGDEARIQIDIVASDSIVLQDDNRAESEFKHKENRNISKLNDELLSQVIRTDEIVGDEADVVAELERQSEIAVSSNGSEQLLSLLHQAIDKHKRYPYQARRQRREGLVKLQFVVHPNGQVTNVSVVQSSRFDALDDAARDAVNAISPFQLAANYIYEQHIYDVDIDFRLN